MSAEDCKGKNTHKEDTGEEFTCTSAQGIVSMNEKTYSPFEQIHDVLVSREINDGSLGLC